MKKRNSSTIFLITINLIGLIALIYFAIPYLTHDVTVPYPDAMLPAQAWENARMALTLGFLPLLIVNLLGFLYADIERKFARFLFLVPSVGCGILVASYWIPAFLSLK